uniref:Uncharacterized protein n=1 Tax=Candidatus Methanogaster sp. ANME-2c ERB4 TaxID=2759911 RepID=A0A7G9YJ52_9EURY|nr:hypothetical protein IFFKNINF_00005 [Methanosarcinales archaeon ANME-2c ERB4]
MINRSILEEQLLTGIADVPIDFLPKITEMIRTIKRELLISVTDGKCSELQLKKFRDARSSWSDLDIEDIYRKFNEDMGRWTFEESV